MDHGSKDQVNRDALEGHYANYFKVGHNALEFVLDFGQFYNGSDTAHVHTRIITNPSYAKALLQTLRDAIAKYEDAFGDIPKENERGSSQ